MRAKSLSRADVARLYNKAGREAPIQVKRALATLSKMMALAISRGLRAESNPCMHVQRFKEKKGERFLPA